MGEEEINLLKLYLALRGISFDQEVLGGNFFLFTKANFYRIKLNLIFNSYIGKFPNNKLVILVNINRLKPQTTKAPNKTRGRGMIRLPITTATSAPNKKRKFMIKRKRPIIKINNNEYEDIEEEERTVDILQVAGSGRNLNIYQDLKPETKAPGYIKSVCLKLNGVSLENFF